jgi:glutathione reductase (NADPH)
VKAQQEDDAMTFDLIVIGTGTAAATAAHRCAGAGWRVAVIDHLPYGGTCALRGCDPKKVLVGVVEALDDARRMRGRGLSGDVSIDWRELMAFKRSFTEPVPANVEQSFRNKEMATYRGRARFAGPRSVEVGGERLEGRFVLIATGAEPVKLGIPGEEHLVTSTEFLELKDLPAHIALVGGGYIAAEFSHIAARAGARVTVVQRGDRMLSSFDADLVASLTEKSRDIGIHVRLKTTVERIEKTSGGFAVHTIADETRESFPADLVVHAAGRAADLDSLNLEAAGIESEKGRLKLNDYLQSVSNPGVYAAGDAAAKGPPLTPVAAHDGRVASANILKGNHRKPNYVGVPSVAFTLPPIAAVGLTEASAQAQGLKFRTHVQDASDWYTARRVAEPTYGFKVLLEERTDRILGAHLVGPHADEVINVFAFAIRTGRTAKELQDAIFAYPTGASDIGHML